jgi:Domain of unknown function (DUF4124)
MKINKFILVIFLIFASLTSYGDTYKWTDENGKVNFGDSVPAKYKNKSKKIDTTNSNSSISQIEPTVKNKEKVPSVSSTKVEEVGIDETVGNLGQNKQENKPTDCEGQWKLYKESQACFDKYSLVNGHRKAAEALKHCTDLKQPYCPNIIK